MQGGSHHAALAGLDCLRLTPPAHAPPPLACRAMAIIINGNDTAALRTGLEAAAEYSECAGLPLLRAAAAAAAAACRRRHPRRSEHPATLPPRPLPRCPKTEDALSLQQPQNTYDKPGLSWLYPTDGCCTGGKVRAWRLVRAGGAARGEAAAGAECESPHATAARPPPSVLQDCHLNYGGVWSEPATTLYLAAALGLQGGRAAWFATAHFACPPAPGSYSCYYPYTSSLQPTPLRCDQLRTALQAAAALAPRLGYGSTEQVRWGPGGGPALSRRLQRTPSCQLAASARTAPALPPQVAASARNATLPRAWLACILHGEELPTEYSPELCYN